MEIIIGIFQNLEFDNFMDLLALFLQLLTYTASNGYVVLRWLFSGLALSLDIGMRRIIVVLSQALPTSRILPKLHCCPRTSDCHAKCLDG